MSEITTAWKFLDEHEPGVLRSRHGYHTWKIGVWYALESLQPIKTCVNGFHASPTPREAMSYVAGIILAEVECRGESHSDSEDKSAWREMRIVRAWRLDKRDMVRLAVHCARTVLPIWTGCRPGDARPLKAIQAAEKWLSASASAASAYAASADAASASTSAYADAAYASASASAAAAAAAAAAASAASAASAAAAARRTGLSGSRATHASPDATAEIDAFWRDHLIPGLTQIGS